MCPETLNKHPGTGKLWFFKGKFPLHKMNGDFAVKFIRACAFTVVCSLTGEIVFFNIGKINLTNLGWKKFPQLLDQPKHKLSTFLANTVASNQIKDGC